VGLVVQAFLILSINRRLTRQTHMLRQFFSGPAGEDLEGLLNRTLEQSTQAQAEAQTALGRVYEVSAQLAECMQRFALVRYDAFDDVTGQQSFSLALLDGNNNGTIVTALFSRHSSRCFGKMIVAGQPEQPLSDEEKRVLSEALGSKPNARANGLVMSEIDPFEVSASDSSTKRAARRARLVEAGS
jgi:hypothetical protein